MLSAVRVLDCSDESGWLAGRILADLGADVVVVEPPGGDRARRRGPFLGGDDDPERSLPWQAFHAGQRGITLDGAAPAARPALARLLDRADVLIETCEPAARAAWGFEPAALAALHPRLVHCSLTPFGRTGPHAGFHAGDLVVVAMGGNAALTGDPDRPPLRCTLPTAWLHAGPEAALAVLMALHARARTGRGQHVDVSIQECQLQTLLGAPGAAARTGRSPRRSGPRTGRTREIWAARDGWISFGLRGGPSRAPGLRALVAWMAEEGAAPDWLKATDWAAFRPDRLDAAELARLEDAFAAFFAARSREALFAGALARRVLLAPCNDAPAIAAQPQLRARGLFTTLALAEPGAALELPGPFARASGCALGPRRRAPRIGEHNAEVFAAAGLAPAELEKLAAEGLS
jgi:crotonobetainyl-CoA:carnitine CoA-transferase CaiB-like acyl-CoA transferase